MEIWLRPAVAADLEVVASWLESKLECERWGGPAITFPIVPSVLAEEIGFERERSYTLVGEGSEILGFGQLIERENDRFHLGRIITDRARRGMGLGTILCTKLIEEGLSVKRVSAFTLKVYKDNLIALSLYRKLGFLVDGEGEEVITMVKLSGCVR